MDNGKETLICKSSLCFYIANKEQKKLDENLINKLIINFSDLRKVLQLNIPGIITFLYFNRIYIHKILQNEEEIITINNKEYEKKLSFNFYLNLLIEEDFNTINYQYSIEFIKDIFNNYKNIKGEFELLLISKIILTLIKNYKGTDYYDDNNKEEVDELKKIEEQKKKIIENHSNIIDNINFKKIDEIYIEIIISLIKNKKFEDYDYSFNIINQLDLDNIALTPIMFDKLSDIFNCKENYITDYLIKDVKDLFDEKKILFYYFSLKYIFKNPLYIYQISFFSKTRNIILKLLKSNKIIFNKSNQNIKDKFEFVLEKLGDSIYYFQLISELDLIKLKEVLKYYKEFLFESKKEHILSIENAIINNKGVYKKYLQDYDISIKINNRAPIIKYFSKRKSNNNPTKEEELSRFIKIWNKYEKLIKIKDLNKINEDDKYILIDYFNNDTNKDIIMKIFKPEEYEFFVQDKDISTKIESKINQQNDSSVKGDSSNMVREDNKNLSINNNNISNNSIRENDEIYGEEGYRLSMLKNDGNESIFDASNNTSFNIKDIKIEKKNFYDIASYIKNIFKKYTYKIQLEKGNIIAEFSLFEYFSEIIISSEEELDYEHIKLKDNFLRLIKFVEEIKKEIKNCGIERLEIYLTFQENNFEKNSSNRYFNINCEYNIIKEGKTLNEGEKYFDNNILNTFSNEKFSHENFTKYLNILKKDNLNKTISLGGGSSLSNNMFSSSMNSQNTKEIYSNLSPNFSPECINV